MQRAKLIKNNITVNESITGSSKALQDEIKKLKEEIERNAEKKYICESCKRTRSIGSLMGAEHFLNVNKQVRQSIRQSRDINLAQIEQIRKEHCVNAETIIEEDEDSEEKRSIGSVDSTEKDKDKSIKKRIKGILILSLEFMIKVNFLMNYENLLVDKLHNLETINKGLLELNQVRDSHIQENKTFNEQLDKKAFHIHAVMKINESLMQNNKILVQEESNKNSENIMIDSKNLNAFIEESSKLRSALDQNVNSLKTEVDLSNLKQDFDILKQTKNVDIILNKANVEILVSIFNDFIEKNKELQTFIAENIEFYLKDENIEKMRIEITELNANQKILDTIIEDMKNDNYLLTEENTRLKDKELINSVGTEIEKKYLELQNNYNKLLLEMNDMNINYEEKLNLIDKLNETIRLLDIKCSDNETTFTQYKDEIDTLSEGNKIIENQMNKYNDEIARLTIINKEIINLKINIKTLEEENSVNKLREEDLKRKLETLSAVVENSGKMEITLEEMRKKLSELEKEVVNKDEKIKSIECEKEIVNERLKVFIKETKIKANEMDNLISEFNREKHMLNKRINELINETISLESKLENLTKEFSIEKDTLNERIQELIKQAKMKDLAKERIIKQNAEEKLAFEKTIQDSIIKEKYKELEHEKLRNDCMKEKESLNEKIISLMNDLKSHQKIHEEITNELRIDNELYIKKIKELTTEAKVKILQKEKYILEYKKEREDLINQSNKEKTELSDKVNELVDNANSNALLKDTNYKEEKRSKEALNEQIKVLTESVKDMNLAMENIINQRIKALNNEIDKNEREKNSLSKRVDDLIAECQSKDKHRDNSLNEKDVFLKRINDLSEELRTKHEEKQKILTQFTREKDSLNMKMVTILDESIQKDKKLEEYSFELHNALKSKDELHMSTSYITKENKDLENKVLCLENKNNELLSIYTESLNNNLVLEKKYNQVSISESKLLFVTEKLTRLNENVKDNILR